MRVIKPYCLTVPENIGAYTKRSMFNMFKYLKLEEQIFNTLFFSFLINLKQKDKALNVSILL